MQLASPLLWKLTVIQPTGIILRNLNASSHNTTHNYNKRATPTACVLTDSEYGYFHANNLKKYQT